MGSLRPSFPRASLVVAPGLRPHGSHVVDQKREKNIYLYTCVLANKAHFKCYFINLIPAYHSSWMVKSIP